MQKMKEIQELLYRINVGGYIEEEILKKAFEEILILKNEIERGLLMGSIFTGLMVSSPKAYYVKVILDAIFEFDGYKREEMPCFNGVNVIEYAGSGKKGIKTMNISTLSAIVAVGAGAKVLKKGSHSTSSLTGSADFIEDMGGRCLKTKEEIENAIETIGFAFTNIEDLIPQFDAIYNGRFYAPHILSYGLAAILSPMRGNKIFYGLANPNPDKPEKFIITSAPFYVILKKKGVFICYLQISIPTKSTVPLPAMTA